MIMETPELKTLLENQDDHSVSIYLPMFPAGKDTVQGPIRFRNQIAQAEKQLLSRGASNTMLDELLHPARQLAGDHDFWKRQSLGLAVYISPAMFKYFRLPVSFEERLTINSRFNLKQLLKLLAGEGRYFILWISKGGVKLYDCTGYGLRELSIKGLPQDIGEMLAAVDSKETGHHAPNARHSPGGESHQGAFHGHGSVLDTDKTDTLKYFRQVDKGLRQQLSQSNAPLLLCGVKNLHALYREANTYPNLMEKGIMRNPEHPTELHRLSWEIMRDHFDHEREQAISLYYSSQGTGLASSNMQEIIPAADDGRVRYLFVEVDAGIWGRYDSDLHAVSIHPEREHGDEDLLDLASIRTLLGNGAVYAVDKSNIPNGSQLSAVFRY